GENFFYGRNSDRWRMGWLAHLKLCPLEWLPQWKPGDTYGSRRFPSRYQRWRAQESSPERPRKRTERLRCAQYRCCRNVYRPKAWAARKVPYRTTPEAAIRR